MLYNSKVAHQKFPALAVLHIMFSQLFSNAASAAKTRVSKHSEQQWEEQKPNIERLYIAEDKSLKEVICILDQDFSFIARYVNGHVISFKALI
jgi:hypothetical protein